MQLTTITVIFDGEVFRPETPINLERDQRYVITIKPESVPIMLTPETTENSWDILEGMIGTVEAPPDWSKEHDHYLYGTPKRHEQE
jgi:hypothetical protein